ncbi:MAG: endolytic transglycosylase MltG [Candidatus Magasanikbacteria bacterium]|nr:endolytic transglycosylase MltG [Candidatus Magasanikbacteria bacterium]
MSLRAKVLLLIFFVGGSFFVFKIYRHFHPVYIPIPPRPEVTITIIPGWNLRQVAEYLVLKGFASTTDDVYRITGEPARDYRMVANRGPHIELDTSITQFKERNISYEGYLAPETYRVFADARLEDVIKKLIKERDKQFTADIYKAVNKSGASVHEIITMASIVEREVKHDEDRTKVADILWRRVRRGWALQVDSSVHYAVDRTGDVFTTNKERDMDSPWNTYKYPGLPPGPISNPGLESIKAALSPEKNEYWYFLSGRDGKMYYGKTLEEHNANKKYL